MGIQGLARLIADYAPDAVKENEIKNFFGRKIAIDASMSIYQFLIAVRQQGVQLTTAEGDTTSHLMGMFYRTIRMVENGIKPVYVFDGKPPEMKGGELAKRAERREETEKALKVAEETGNEEEVNKLNRRLVKVTRDHNDECKKLLKLMGIPYVEAPTEAEAQCAAMVKAGKAYAIATEDMDGLTFGTPIMLRHMTFSEARKMPIKEYHLSKVLDSLGLNHDEFIDLCILLGCDYCGSIRGIGPKRAVELIKEHRSIEKILEKLDKTKYPVPENWAFAEARKLFQEPDVTSPDELPLKWQEPDVEGLVEFLVKEKSFAEDRVRSGAKKLQKGRTGSVQQRMDSFFTVVSVSNNASKRKAEEMDKKNTKKTRGGGATRGRKPK